ncbi:MAG TPA: serine--tRNA ligase [Solirubrobacteraceae bacterium]|nr:serine--tRNA ligase [Solirubrobacteraceae bacterium]
MLDIRLIREQPDAVRVALQRRDPALLATVEEIRARDEEWRAATTMAESLRARQRADSEQIAAGKRAGEDVSGLLAGMKELSAEVKARIEQAESAKQTRDALLIKLPNLPDPTAAPGPKDELVRTVGEPPELGFPARDHLDLAGGRIDMDRAANLSGSRFAYLKGELVLLELALVRWVLEKLLGHGFEPVIPPVLVRERALFGTGFLPDTEQQIYELPADELYLVGTSEVALASLHDDEILDAERLPLRYAGFSPCFRREAGAAGRDTRGIFRVHQFDKVEMFSFVEPEHSADEHERILAIEEQILGELGLPYRVVNIAVNDLGGSAAKKYDCEAWMPSQGRYRELTSCSNTTDYQARRLGIRVRREKGTEVLHTLNGTAVAVGRTLVALLENGQRADGSVALPACLQPFGAPAELSAA